MDDQQTNEEQPQGEVQPEQNSTAEMQEQPSVETSPQEQEYSPELQQVDQNTKANLEQQIPEQPQQQVQEPIETPQPPLSPPEQQEPIPPVTIFSPSATVMSVPEQPSPQTTTDRVSSLSDEELEAAHRLWQSKKIREYQKLSVSARKARQQAALDKILTYVRGHSPAKIPRMANELDMSPRLVAHYLQKLVKSGQVRAEGWSKGRKYFA